MFKKNTYKKLFVLFIPFILIACGEEVQQQKETPEEMTAADYVEQATFVTLEGDTVSIADFKGKVVMIDFWETWCKPCLASFSTIQKLQKRYSEQFVVLAVTPGFSDTREDALEFKKSHNYGFIYAMDTSGLHKKLGVTAIPFKVFIAANGDFIKTALGRYGEKQGYKKIEKIIKKYSGQS